MTWPWEKSIRARILLIVVGLLGVALLILNLGMARLLAKAELEESASHLQIQALLAAKTLEDPLSGYHHELEDYEEHDDDDDHKQPKSSETASGLLPGWAKAYARESGVSILVTDRSGRRMAGEGPPLTREDLAASNQGRSLHYWTKDRLFAIAPVVNGESLQGVVRLSQRRAEAAGRSRALSLKLAAVSLLALFVAVVAAFWLSRRLVEPLKELEASALRVSKGEWGLTLDTTGEDELATLARAFTTMLDELRSMLDRQRRFVSNASHELRTPLTRIKLRTEALLDGALEDPQVSRRFVAEVDGEADRLARLANALLALNRLDEAFGGGLVSDPLTVIKTALSSFEASAKDRGLSLSADLPESLSPLPLSVEALDSLLTNLLDNAMKYTPAGGKILLSAEERNGMVRLRVKDNGIGIDSKHLPHLFERFYRVDEARSVGGTGLGLALVRSTVESCQGTVEVESKPGRGSLFTITLPVRSVSPS